MIAEYNSPQDPPPSGGDDPDNSDSETDNQGTLILDATCAPKQISYPQDVNLLNEVREIWKPSLIGFVTNIIITSRECIVKKQGRII